MENYVLCYWCFSTSDTIYVWQEPESANVPESGEESPSKKNSLQCGYGSSCDLSGLGGVVADKANDSDKCIGITEVVA